MKIFFALFILFFYNISFANKGPVTGLDLPRFVSLKSDDSNVRVGPSKNYPILRKYIIPYDSNVRRSYIFKKSNSKNTIWGDSQSLNSINSSESCKF